MTDAAFTLSFVLSDTVHNFTNARAAGEFLARANEVFKPRMICNDGREERVISDTVQVGSQYGPSALDIDRVRSLHTGIDQEFWLAYHEKRASLYPGLPARAWPPKGYLRRFDANTRTAC